MAAPYNPAQPRDRAGQWTSGAPAVRSHFTKAKGRDLKAEQDARIRGATRQRMAHEQAVTQRHQAIWAGRPSKGGG